MEISFLMIGFRKLFLLFDCMKFLSKKESEIRVALQIHQHFFYSIRLFVEGICSFVKSAKPEMLAARRIRKFSAKQ